MNKSQSAVLHLICISTFLLMSVSSQLQLNRLERSLKGIDAWMVMLLKDITPPLPGIISDCMAGNQDKVITDPHTCFHASEKTGSQVGL